MDFRWKVPELKPNFVDPQGVRSTMAAQQMQGYAPNAQAMNAANAMQGYKPNVPTSSAFNNEQLAQQNYDSFNSELQEKKQRLAVLENKLAEIDNNIAQLQQGGADEEKAIAAKLAEIGDTSLYQGILSREQNQAAQQKSNASSIDNMLFEADKLSWGLNSKSDEERGIVKQNIQAVLDRAKQVAEQTGTPLPPKYSELERKLEDSDKASMVYESDLKRANELYILYRKGGLEDSHIKEMEDYIEKNPNSEIATQYRQLIEQYKGKTKESRAAASKRKQDALDLYYSLNGLSKDEITKRIANMSPRERKLLEDFHPEMLK